MRGARRGGMGLGRGRRRVVRRVAVGGAMAGAGMRRRRGRRRMSILPILIILVIIISATGLLADFSFAFITSRIGWTPILVGAVILLFITRLVRGRRGYEQEYYEDDYEQQSNDSNSDLQ